MGVMLNNLGSEYLKSIYEANYITEYFGSRIVSVLSLDSLYGRFVIENKLDYNNEYVFKLFKIIIESMYLINCYSLQNGDQNDGELDYDVSAELAAMLEYEYTEIEDNLYINLSSVITLEEYLFYVSEDIGIIEKNLYLNHTLVSNLVIDWGTKDNVLCSTVDGSNINLDLTF